MDQARTLRELMGTTRSDWNFEHVTVTLSGTRIGIGVQTLASWFEFFIRTNRLIPHVYRTAPARRERDLEVGHSILIKALDPKEPYESYGVDDFHILVLSTERTSLRIAYEYFRKLRDMRGVKRVGIIVNQVTDLEMIPVLLNRLCEFLQHSDGLEDVRLDYLGHCPLDAKIPTFAFSEDHLVQSKSELTSFRCLEMLGKRLVGWCFESRLNKTQEEEVTL